MEIKITSQYMTNEQFDLFDEFINYCVKRFKLSSKNGRIWVSVCTNLENNDEGDCFLDKKCLLNTVKVRVRHHRNTKRMLHILAHEMVHAKQFLNGQLEFIKGKAYWKGEKVGKMEYNEQPHEKEAFEAEKPLVEDFYKARKKRLAKRPDKRPILE